MAVPDAGVPANSGTALLSIGTTDNQGRYRLENVLPGRYYITAGFVDLPTYYPGVSAVSGATVVNVLPGTSVTGINFAAANTLGVAVSGRVRRLTGSGGVGGQLVRMIGGSSSIQQATTAADGTFQFQRVLPGTYQLSSAAGRPNQPLSVVVGDQNIAGLEFIVIPTVTVTGNIAIEGNGPRPRIQLQLAPFRGTSQTTGMSTQPDGTFRAIVPEGDYRVSWSNLPVGHEIKSITAGSVDLLSTALKVSADAPPEPIKILLAVDGNPWVKVSGRVTNLGSNRTLTLTGPNVDQIQVTLNPDGTFEIPQALPGTYQVRPNLTATTPPLVFQSGSVVIPSQDTTNLVISLPLTRDVPGIVVNNSGAGMQGRLSMSYSQTSGTGSTSGSRTIGTQADGKFSLEVPDGSDVRLTLSVPGYTVKSATYGTTDLMRENMRVTAKDTAEIRVVLDTTSSIMPGGGVNGGGGVLGGIVTSTLSAGAAPPPPPPPPPPALTVASSTAEINRISEAVAKPNLVSSAPPSYPALAMAARVQGTVVLQVEISTEGRVQNIRPLSGHALLNEAAIQAVRQWTYKPFVLNGQTIPVTTTATVNFTLP